MPTGYTEIIYNRDDVTLNEFAMRCARQLGVLIHMRDEPLDAEIPHEFTPSPYHRTQFREASRDFYRSASLRNDEADRRALEDYENKIKEIKSMKARRGQIIDRYNTMLDKVNGWQPPTPEHEGLKKFMIRQLEQSLEHDAPHPDEMPQRLNPQEYREQLTKKAQWRMNYHKKKFEEEVEGAKYRTQWVSQLKDSFQ